MTMILYLDKVFFKQSNFYRNIVILIGNFILKGTFKNDLTIDYHDLSLIVDDNK